MDRWSPDRVLAECEAKRRIVEWASRPVARFTFDQPPEFSEVTFSRERVYLDALRNIDVADEHQAMLEQHAQPVHPEVLAWLALPYVDHPDYDEEWKA
jgi:hypothetical protein